MSQPTTPISTTQVCRYFAATGNCFYGDQCNFAHIRPTNEGEFPPLPSHKPKSAIPCRNIAIHGFCKFQGKGCEYSHDPVEKSDEIQHLATSPQKAADYAAFRTNLKPQEANKTGMETQFGDAFNPMKRGGTTYFYAPEEQPINPLQYNSSVPSLPHTTNKAPYGRRLHSFFMADDIRKELSKRGQLTYQTLDPQDPRAHDIPNIVHRYHTLYPLDDPYKTNSSSASLYGYPTSLFKCISSVDGLPYVIRRIEGFRLSSEQPLRMGEMWKQIQHPNIATLVEIFISKDFGDVNSVFFAYQYYPNSETLESRYLLNGNSSDHIAEQVLWSYITQIVAAIRTVHNARLACRSIALSKIIITSKNRIRLSGCAVQDVVNFDPNKSHVNYQYEDLLSLGHLIVTLCCKSPSAVQNLNKSMEFIGTRYSPELKNLILYLLTKTNGVNFPTIDEVVSMTAVHFVTEVENLHANTDYLEGEMVKEIENGRLFRLLAKLGFINERPEFDMDPSWSETGDRYLLKLFRDYVFHQVYEDGSPVVDLAHVVECLNKLDAGVEEKIVLTSRDEQSILVVSYKDLKRCIMESFNELTTKKPFNYRFGYGGKR